MKYKDKDWLQDQYCNKMRSTVQIGRENHVTKSTICYWLKQFGIPRRNPATFKGENATHQSIHEYIRKRHPPPDKCQECGKIDHRLNLANIINHKYTRNIEDYKYLCVKCHQTLDGSLEGCKPYRFKKGKENISNIDHWRNRK